MEADLLVIGGTVVTAQALEGPALAQQEPATLKDWAVAIRDQTIVWMGPSQDWDGVATQTIDATGKLVTPGYVDCHNHLVYGGDRAFEIALKLKGTEYLDILAAGGGIAHTVGATRAAGPTGLIEQTLPRMGRMIGHGTTTFEAKSGYGLNLETELHLLAAGAELAKRLDVPVHGTFLGAHAVPDDMRPDEAVQAVLGMIPHVAKQGIAQFCDVFVEQGVFTPAHGQEIFDAARKAGMKLRLHADEIVNTGGAELAAQAGCVSADHLLRVSSAGIDAMASAGTIATLLPTVPLTLMRPEWAPAKQFLAAGVPVALASDHNPNNPVTNMSFVAQLACYAMGLTPAQALLGVTWNGACALDAQATVGSLEVGKRADLIVHCVPDLDHWVYEPGRSTAEVVVAGGTVR